MSLLYRDQPFQVCPRCQAALPMQVLVCHNCGCIVSSKYADRARDRLERNTTADRQQPLPMNSAQGSNQQPWVSNVVGNNQQPWAGQNIPPQRWAGNSTAGNPLVQTGNSVPGNQALPGWGRKEDRSQDKTRAALLYFVITLLAVFVLAFVGLRGAGVTPTMLEQALLHTPPPHKITYAPPKGTPLFADPLINDTSGWNLQSSPGDYLVAVSSNGLTLESDQHRLLWELLPGERSYSNFTLIVNAALTKGDQNNGYGVYIRGTANEESDLATYYRLELYGDGSYAIFKGVVGASGAASAIKIAGYTLNPAIQKAGKVNHIMIVAKGALLELIVNGKMVKSIDDASYGAGSIALFVSNLPEASGGAQAQFSQLEIFPVGQ